MIAFISQGYTQIKLGIKGGVNWNYVKADDILINNRKTLLTIPSKANMGYHIGFVSQIRLFNLFVQPELLFSTNKNDVILKDAITPTITKGFAEQRTYRLDIPVMIGIRIKSLKVEAGPIGTIFLGQKSDLIDITDFNQKYKTATFGYQAGIGFGFSKITLDFKYEGNLSKFGDKLSIDNQTYSFDQRSNQLVFGIGIFF